MGFLDKMMDVANQIEHADKRSSLNETFLSFADKALALHQAGRLDPEKMCKLAKFDSALLQEFIKCPANKIPGSAKERAEMRSIAEQARVLAIESELE